MRKNPFRLFSKGRVFNAADWLAFAVATLVTLVVYCCTLGPSVGLEDSGELATASAHLGVPHPPGYPFWSVCTWLFCKIFGFVTYMGHPTPAWAVSLASAVFGAFAAGCTAMLICRSAQDFLGLNASDATLDDPNEGGGAMRWLCFGGAVGGALAFAFSPVEWSQATIVEIYSLNSLFLMWVLLLSYKWMRKPSDATLWATAFIFGLGLTNYQVLLFAIAPLAVIIALRNIPLFRDFALFIIPALLTFQVLDVGNLDRAQYGMERDSIAKHAPAGMSDLDYAVALSGPYFEYVLKEPNTFANYKGRVQDSLKQLRGQREATDAVQAKAQKQQRIATEAHLRMLEEVERLAKTLPADQRKKMIASGASREVAGRTTAAPWGAGLVLSLVLLVGSFLASLALRAKGRMRPAFLAALGGGGGSVALMLLSSVVGGSTELVWSGAELAQAPLLSPRSYVMVAAWAAASAVASIAGVAAPTPTHRKRCLIASIACALVAAVVAFIVSVPSFDLASAFGYGGEPYVWAKSTFLFLAVVVALFALASFVKDGLFYAIPVAGFHLAVFILLRNGAMNGLTHPATWWFWWPFAWNFVVMALVWNILPNGRSVVGAAFFTQLGVAFYAYMPIVSDLRNPPMNWGYPRTWDGFKHAITRGQYEQIKAEEFASFGAFWDFFKVQMGHYFSDVKMQFTDFLAFLALVPFACWRLFVKGGGRRWAVRLLWGVTAVLGLLLVLELSGASGSGAALLEEALLSVLGALALCGCLIVGVKQFLFRPAVALRHFIERCRAKGERAPLVALGVLAGELLVVPLVLVVQFGTGGKAAALIFVWLAVMASLIVNLRVLLRTLRAWRKGGFGLGFEARDVTQQWLISSGACFLMMSVLLIILAKVVGDVQDGFIQKVKFISSHAMIALWIGYGLVCVAALLFRFVPARLRKPLVVPAVLVLSLGAALPPIYQNYAGDISSPDSVVFQLGGAEQNGHTFGWQFGAYQLDGAKAIRAQIEADEEPLPDPEWPAPMEDHAFFFGGTDPGRFVPTYMIYSANYRPDVYLITQNALADGTYMSVERDLYGDEIWIPSTSDNSRAFEEFTTRLTPEEEALYGVDKSNGRVQVTGANSVMKINEILARMMFDNNRDRHAFYIEESYPMDWMYDYLTPHGLIMKVERNPHQTRGGTKGDKVSSVDWAALKRKDMDFWDWYTRRLLDDPMFRRDFAAQKSFAKLRSAIAGLYLRLPPALGTESGFQAYRESCLLAPISPESTFHYMQIQWMNRQADASRCFIVDTSALNVIEDMLDFIDRMDPNNRRTSPKMGFNWREMVAVWRAYFAAEEDFAKAGAQATAAQAYRFAQATASVARFDRRWTNPGVAIPFNDRAATLMAAALPLLTDAGEIEQATLLLANSRKFGKEILQGRQRYMRLTRGRSTTALDIATVKAYYWLGDKTNAFNLLGVLINGKPKEIERACQSDADLRTIVNALNEAYRKMKKE